MATPWKAKDRPEVAVSAGAYATLGLLCGAILAVRQARLNSFDSDGIQIAYRIAGTTGDPVILLHAYLVDTRWNWDSTGLIDLLSKDFQVIAMDLRGHGSSGKPHYRSAYGHEMLHDVTRLLDHLGIARSHLFGFSMGGEIALAYLVHNPDRVDKAVVAGAGLVEHGDPKHALWKTDGDRIGAVKPGDRITDVLFPGVELDESFAHTIDRNDPLALSAAANGMCDLALDARQLAENTTPTLLLVGERDDYKPCADKALLVGGQMEMRVLAGRGHVDSVSDPRFGGIAKDFLLGAA